MPIRMLKNENGNTRPKNIPNVDNCFSMIGYAVKLIDNSMVTVVIQIDKN
jgi:hypothetical protein